jgi:Ca2+-binding EF-hand superfamily protein
MNGLMKLMDKDGSGAIDFEEFATVMGAQFYKQPSKKDLEEAFKYFDKDSSGTIMFIIKT